MEGLRCPKLRNGKIFDPWTNAGVPSVGLSKPRSLTDLSAGSDFTPNELSLPQKINRGRICKFRALRRKDSKAQHKLPPAPESAGQ